MNTAMNKTKMINTIGTIMKKFKTAGPVVFLLFATQAWAALSPGVVAEVRTTGANTNGGAFNTAASGTDMSQYDNKNASGCSSCQSASANLSTTDAVTNNTTTVTSATAAFTSAIVGNVIYLSGTGTTTGWYEVTGFTNSTTITVDRVTGSTGGTGVTMNIGGAWKFGGTLDDDFLESFEAGNIIYVKSGSYTTGEVISTAKAGGASNLIKIVGYNSTRTDAPKSSSRPTIDAAAFGWTSGTSWAFWYVDVTGTTTATMTTGAANQLVWSKFSNTSNTADRAALSIGSDNIVFACEMFSLRGRALVASAVGSQIVGSWLHDSAVGLYINSTSATVTAMFNLITGNYTAAVQIAAASVAGMTFAYNTLYGAEAGAAGATGMGIGVSLATGVTDFRLVGNIIKGFATGVSHADTQSIGLDLYNVYHGNNANVNGTGNWQIGVGSVTATNPSFTSITQVNGCASGCGTSLASSSGSTITAGSGTPFTNVVDNVDYITVFTATTATAMKYRITGHTGNTVTVSPAIGTGSNIDWEVTSGRDFSIGTALKAAAFPGLFPGGLTTGYLDPGAVQRQEPAGGGGVRIYLGGN